MIVLVTGGTGSVGRHVVASLRHHGHRAVVMSRRPGTRPDWRQADLGTGEGLGEAVRGVEAIVHAGSATTRLDRGRAVDVEGTRRLAAAARDAGVAHLVLISIAGIDGVAYPYYRTKLGAEAAVEENLVPWTILRATQFHALMELFLGAFSKLPGLIAIPAGWRFQPVDAREVGDRLAEVAVGSPSGRLPDFGGPEARSFSSLAASWKEATGSRRRIIELPLPLKFSRQFAAGRLLAPGHLDGKVTFEQYLERRYPDFSGVAGPG